MIKQHMYFVSNMIRSLHEADRGGWKGGRGEGGGEEHQLRTASFPVYANMSMNMDSSVDMGDGESDYDILRL